MKRQNYIQKVFQNAAKVAHLTYQIGQSDILREKSKAVPEKQIPSREIRSVISKLKKVLAEYKKLTGKGRGIAAIQIGIPLKIAVVNIKQQSVTIINPKIIRRSKQLFIYPEICMSANPIIAKVVRPGWVEVEYLDETGRKQFWDEKQDKITNRVFQHEIEHMSGIINIDLVRSRELTFDSDPDYLKSAEFTEVKRNGARKGSVSD